MKLCFVQVLPTQMTVGVAKLEGMIEWMYNCLLENIKLCIIKVLF